MLPRQFRPEKHDYLFKRLVNTKGDLSQDILLFIAFAYLAVQYLNRLMPSKELETLQKDLQRCYIAAVRIRTGLPVEELNKKPSSFWNFKLTRFGNYED